MYIINLPFLKTILDKLNQNNFNQLLFKQQSIFLQQNLPSLIHQAPQMKQIVRVKVQSQLMEEV